MRVSKNKKNIGLAALFFSTIAMVSPGYAADIEATEEYVWDAILVTAQRYEKKDLDIGAATDVYTSEQLKNTGARNLQQALAMATGVIYQAKGPGGASLGSMTSKISIRGVEKGTLLLINGTPVNLRGLYNLEDMPLDNVERIEVVKGGGAVLYGSEATGGVINIIMKKEMPNTVTVGGGNQGQQNYALTMQADKLGFSYTYDKWGDVGKVSSTLAVPEMYNVFNGSEKNNITLNYVFDQNIDLMYSHNESASRYTYTFGTGYEKKNLVDKARYERKYDNTKDFVQLNVKHDALKGNLYYNTNSLHSTGMEYYSSSGESSGYPQWKDSKEKNRTYGFDLQNIWKTSESTLLFGATYQNESYTPEVKETTQYERNNYSLYGQWEAPLRAADTFTLSARKSWTGGADEDKNYHNFSAQGQFVHKLSENSSVYASIGQSYVMPTFAQMYSTGGKMVVGDPNLRPQSGIHYELGWKKNHRDHKWRAALFNYDIEDNISFSKFENQYYAINEDLKNTGIELSAEVKGNNGWSYQYGLTYGDPKARAKSEKPGVKTYWDRNFGRLQLNGGATYQMDKWTASLSANYLARRVLTPSTGPSFETKPYLLTSLNVNYAVDAVSAINLSIDNVLDRQDNVNHTSSAYYTTPINYMLSYKYKF